MQHQKSFLKKQSFFYVYVYAAQTKNLSKLSYMHVFSYNAN